MKSGNILPTAKKFPQPKAPQKAGTQVGISGESAKAINALGLAAPVKHNSARPKGV